MKVRNAFSIAAVMLLVAGVGLAGDWTQRGGPGQAFKADSRGLAAEWPERGPRQLWSRDLGDGYSGILVQGDRLYTMYRAGEQEIVIAMDAKTGKTIWEHRYDESPEEGHISQFRDGPRATPMISDGRIYTVGVAGLMHCLDIADGSVKWTKELWGDDFKGNVLQHGYSSAPIAYKDSVIVLVGGEGASIVALNKKSGKLKWKSQDHLNSYSTPTLLNVDGEQQVVAFMNDDMIGLDPDDGALRWSFHHEGANVNMPVMADKNLLFLSSPRNGSRGLKLTNKNGKTEVEELWATRKIQFYHVTSVREGDWVYGSTGTGSPAFMSAVNIRTGEIGWRERGIAKANVIAADGKLIVLDEDGKLYLTTATPEGLTVHSTFDLFEQVAWTVPTIVGQTMYVRDVEKIYALDLG